MFFRQIFDEKLAQNAYIVGCQRTGEALVFALGDCSSLPTSNARYWHGMLRGRA